MCYSAQVQADYKKYVVMFGATMSIRDFYEIFYRRGLDPKIKIPNVGHTKRPLMWNCSY